MDEEPNGTTSTALPETRRVAVGVDGSEHARHAALEVAEDGALVEALRRAGGAVVFRRDLAVTTSARISRRVHGGFSDFLSALDDATTPAAVLQTKPSNAATDSALAPP